MEEFKYCRVCLVTDVKMYSLDITSNDSIGLIYSHLAQIRICERNQHVCFECASLLQKYQLFKSKCLRAHNILSNITVKSTEITKEVILNIDRKQNKLKSSYTLSILVQSYDIPPEYSKYKGTESKKISLNQNGAIDIPEVIQTLLTKSESKEAFYGNNGTSYILLNKDVCIEPVKETSKVKTLKKIVKKTKMNKAATKIKVPDPTEEENQYLDELKDHEYDQIITDTSEESSDEIVTKTSAQESKISTCKESKTKQLICTSVSSADDLSDDEPLSKRVTKDVNSIQESVDNENNLDIDVFNEYMTVTFLTLEDARNELHSRKESRYYKRLPFKCEYCFKGYEAQTAFNNHMKKHSTEQGDYECNVCYLRFPKKVNLCKHKLSCHKRKFTCRLCPYICYSMEQARNHASFHQGKKYPCNQCGKIFSMPNSLLMHKHKKHLHTVAENVCEFCGDIFGSARGLYMHSKKLHRMDKNNKEGPNCDECGVHFSSDVAFKRHQVLSTKHAVLNGCKYCGEQFSNVEELQCHKRTHRPRFKQIKYNKKPAACPICNEWLSNSVERNKHVTSEHPHSDEAMKLLNHEFVCEVCGLGFKQQCFLTYHQRKHTGERPHKCLSCGKSFVTASSLKIHRAVHASRAHRCHLCDRLFTFQSTLHKHVKAHLNIRPHKCTICDKGFIHKCDLKVHIKYVHDKVPWPKKKNKRKTMEDNATYEDSH